MAISGGWQMALQTTAEQSYQATLAVVPAFFFLEKICSEGQAGLGCSGGLTLKIPLRKMYMPSIPILGEVVCPGCDGNPHLNPVACLGFKEKRGKHFCPFRHEFTYF